MSSVVTVASSTSAGAAGGSVIDVGALVSQLVQATQAPQQNLINAQMASVTTQISSVGTLKGALSTFQSALSNLSSLSSFNAQTATSSDSTVFTASTTSGAPVGSFAVTVSALASAEQLLSPPLSLDSNGALGTGSLSLSLGNSSFSLNVTASNNTPAGLAAAINSASGNPGITATVIQGSNGPQLLLSSTLTGAANTISVSETDSSGALAALTTDSGNYSVQTAAQDAAFSIAGVAATSASNTISTAISGVVLTLTGVSHSATSTDAQGATTTSYTPSTLTVSTDTSTIQQNIQNFVAAYNALASTFSSLGGYNATTGQAGSMMGNALLTGTQRQINNIIHGLVTTGSSTYNSLASLGITTNQDGTLSLSNQRLSTALSTDYSAVSQLFSGANGVATSLDSTITNLLSSKGNFQTTSDALIKQENSLDTQTTQLQTQMDALTASLTQQYSSLDTLLSSLQTTSAYLTQAFATLPTNQKSSS